MNEALLKASQLACCIVCLAMSGGCGLYGNIHAGLFGYEYTMTFFNHTDVTLTEVQYVNAPFPAPAGILAQGAMKTSTVVEAVPESATISWKDSHGLSHEQTLAIRKNIPQPTLFDGSIVFEMTESKIRLVILSGRDSFIRLRDSNKRVANE